MTEQLVPNGEMSTSRLYIVTVEFMQNTGLDEAQAGIKIARTHANNLRYADDTTLMAEREEELKSLLMKVKENEKLGLKLNIQKMKCLEHLCEDYPALYLLKPPVIDMVLTVVACPRIWVCAYYMKWPLNLNHKFTLGILNIQLTQGVT